MGIMGSTAKLNSKDCKIAGYFPNGINDQTTNVRITNARTSPCFFELLLPRMKLLLNADNRAYATPMEKRKTAIGVGGIDSPNGD